MSEKVARVVISTVGQYTSVDALVQAVVAIPMRVATLGKLQSLVSQLGFFRSLCVHDACAQYEVDEARPCLALTFLDVQVTIVAAADTAHFMMAGQCCSITRQKPGLYFASDGRAPLIAIYGSNPDHLQLIGRERQDLRCQHFGPETLIKPNLKTTMVPNSLGGRGSTSERAFANIREY